MSDATLLKKKLLLVASTGKFSTFTPHQLQKYKDELNIFLALGPAVTSIELYQLFELQFYLSILTNDDSAAERALARILDKFELNKKSQRIKLLQSIYYEATGDVAKAKELLGANADEIKLSKRLVTFSRNGDDNTAYINNLVFYLGLQPGDLSTWAELGDEYFKIGHYDEAIFSYKEILLQEPLAYHWFYKIGLCHYYRYLQVLKQSTTKKEVILDCLTQSRNNYLRCIELYENHDKSWLGINILTKIPLNDKLSEAKAYISQNERLAKASSDMLTKLNINVDLK